MKDTMGAGDGEELDDCVDVKPPRKVDAKSPFRYPGGKAAIQAFLESEICQLVGETRHYVEPFAGGAGAALGLLSAGIVQKIHLNDLDIRIYSSWRAMLEETERFVDRLQNVCVDLETWKWAQTVMREADRYSFDLGFATFFINRTSRAGILSGSGPIGGYLQEGTWRMDARFYRETLIDRVKYVGDHASQIDLDCSPALQFLRTKSNLLPDNSTYYFIDPPYVRAGARLYLNAMSNKDHVELASFIGGSHLLNWSVTYDDHPDVRELYQNHRIRKLIVAYSLGKPRREGEVLITASNAVKVAASV